MNHVTYAIAQKELVVPDVERLVRAFSVLADLTALDAQNAANDAYGILWRGLDAESAGALQAAMAHEGLETELVPETEFPALVAVSKVIHRVELRAEHLVVTDPMQRTTEIPWNDILLMAAGRIRDAGATRGHPVHPVHPGEADAGKAEGPGRLVLDLFLVDEVTRLEAVAEDFDFGHLGERLSNDVAVNFQNLVQDLEEHVPHASLNQGAYLACQKPPELFTYPSKHAYQEELVWLLWRIARLRAAESGAGETRASSDS